MHEDDGTAIRQSEGAPPATRSVTDVAAVANTLSIVGPPVAAKIKEAVRPEPKPESPIIQAPPSYSQKATADQ